MKDSLKLIVFVLILGAISALVLIGVDALTKERIKQNQLYEFQYTVLKANDESTDGDINERFLEVMEEEYDEESGLTIYTHKQTKNVSFTFEGNGLWDVIEGILTLKEDFKTIVDVTITEQGETPGLGALVAEREFLDTLTGKIFNPTITIKKDAVGDSEVDTISGATGTSSQFQVILNRVYQRYYEAFVGELEIIDEDEILEAILIAHGIEFSEEDNLSDLVDENFKTFEEDDLKVYVNINTARITFFDSYELVFGEHANVVEEVLIVLTLNSDFETIYKLQSLDDGNTSHWGKVHLLDQDELDKAINKKFPNIEFTNEENVDEDNVIDGITKATHTRKTFNKAINDLYDKYYEVFNDYNFDIEEDLSVFEEILNFYNIEFSSENVKEVFNENFETKNDEGKELFINKDNNENIIVFEKEYSLGLGENNERPLPDKEKLTTILILKEDFKTISKIIVIHDENSSHWGKTKFFTESILDNAIGVKFPNVLFKAEAKEDNEVDGVSNATTTQEEFNTYLNDVYNSYSSVYLKLTDEQQTLIQVLINNDISYDLDEIILNETYLDDLINDKFNVETYGNYIVYENKETSDLTYYYKATYRLGVNTSAEEDLLTVVTLKEDLETIVSISVLHDELGSHWAKTQLFKEEVLSQAKDKNIMTLKFVVLEENETLKDNEVDADTKATTTKKELNNTLKTFYKDFIINYLELGEDEISIAHMLIDNNVLPSDDLVNDFTENFDQIEETELDIYEHKDTKNITFMFVDDFPLGYEGNDEGPIYVIVTLDESLKTIIGIGYEFMDETSGWGKTRFFTPNNFAKAYGKDVSKFKFADSYDEDEVDGKTGVTYTANRFNELLKETYDLLYDALKEND